LGSGDSVDHIIRSYGDILFDLCESLLWSQSNAQIAFRSILKRIRAGSRFRKYSSYERSWVLRIACDRLLQLCRQTGNRVSPEEQIKIDAYGSVTTRLKQFNSYFHRLMPEDQILLLLKDKYGIPYSEISTAMATPEGSLKIRRQHALRTLEDWLWNSR
jgi:DNA-directed RNA polymerase specialized sigma24 family protein